MDTKVMKTSDPRRLLLNLLDEKKLKRIDKYVRLSVLSIYYHPFLSLNLKYKNIIRPYPNLMVFIKEITFIR